ncbi:MAG: UDP-N-acetylmuramoyl-L-alanyl-D-glutamate--2,6-diaminopimelate ligase [Usitatibacter sp.]
MIASAGFTRSDGARLLDRLAQLGVPLADLTADSRAVKMGSIFVAYPGTVQDGRAFIADAITRGAAAVIWEHTNFKWDERREIPNLGVDNLRGRISEIAGAVYGDPSETLWMAGVTGTNGKTTVSQWIAAASDALGRRSAAIGTLGNGMVGERVEGKNTTPDPIVLQRLLAEYLRRGARNVAMEVSSHGLDQGRVAGIKYNCAVFTNLTRDHLDYHGTMQAYAEAKYRLFGMRGITHAVINVDDATGGEFSRKLHGSGIQVINYSTNPGEVRGPILRASEVRLSEAGVHFRVDGDFGAADVDAGVLGAFNVSNLLAVLGALIAQGITFDDAVGALRGLQPVPGRLERVGGGRTPLVVVDYAHTPDALEKALTALKPTVAAGHKLVCVFGCGGDRDPGKRPMMGQAAARLADQLVVTSDNPRSEDPHAIIEQILAGIAPGQAEAIEDRQVAIFSAVHHARAGDVVLLAGKGHETYQEIAGVRHPFNDREVGAAALAQWEAGTA